MPVSLVNITPTTIYTNSVYLDPNLLCYSRNRLSPVYQTAANILGDLVVQKVNIFLSNLVIDEFWWALLRIFHKNINNRNLYPSDFKSNRSILNPYKYLIDRATQKILRIPKVNILPTHHATNTVIQIANRLMMTEELMPRDCFHLAFTIADNILGFVTSDSDFDSLNLNQYNLTVFKY